MFSEPFNAALFVCFAFVGMASVMIDGVKMMIKKREYAQSAKIYCISKAWALLVILLSASSIAFAIRTLAAFYYGDR